MANTSTFGGRFALFLLMLFLAGTAAAQNCGGKERWGPKDGTDSQAPNIDLTNITPEAVTDPCHHSSAATARRQHDAHCSRRDARLPGAGAIGEVEARTER
jgi:hypothetical protein